MGGSIASIVARSVAQASQRGAPADFPGVVLPNPDNIRPMEDTEVPPTKLSKGAAFFKGNATRPKFDISSPPRNQIEPQFPFLREQ